jgi:hypothetical protein
MIDNESRVEFRLSLVQIWLITGFILSSVAGGTFWFTTTIVDTVHSVAMRQSEMILQAAEDRRDTKQEIDVIRQQIMEFLYKQGKSGG